MIKKVYNPYVCEICKSYRRMFKSSMSQTLWIVCENCGTAFRYRDLKELKTGKDKKKWKVIMKKNYYGIEEAAKKINLPVRKLFYLVKLGYVPYRIINDVILFDDEDIEIIKFYLKLRLKRKWFVGLKKRILKFIKRRKKYEMYKKD